MKTQKQINERINTLKDIFAITKPSAEEKRQIAYRGKNKRILGNRAFLIAQHIADAYNEGTILDWANYNQKKWFGWFNMETPSSGFFFSDSDSWADSWSAASSRLYFKEEDLFWDAVKKFPEIYKQLMVK